MRAVGRVALACGVSFAASGALAAPPRPASDAIATAPASEVDGVTVWGRRKDGIGEAVSASEGVVSFAKFADRPLLRPGELAEVVPGLAATQHSGSGKANQYFLRGFNLDHGTDFSVSFDGVPLNMRTHGHGQGYLDLNGVIPEVIETIAYRKGPYSAELGDFSAAGGASFQTFADSPPSFLEATAGEHDYGRLLAVKSFSPGAWLAVDLETYRGPWDNAEDTQKIDVIGRIKLGQNWSLTGLAYENHWRSTDQIPQRAVDEGLISRLGAIDPTDGGHTQRYIASLQRRAEDGLYVDLYVQRYTLQLWNNFTYFLEDPVHGDQFSQIDERWIYGGSVSKLWPKTLLGFAFKSGLEGRYDDIGKVGLYKTQARSILSTVRQDQVGEYSGAAWTEAARAFGPVRVTAGVRLDGIGADVTSSDPRNSGTSGQVIASPKLAVAWRLSRSWELYGDFGQGFHSNDVRGTTINVVPGSGIGAEGEPAQRVPTFAKATGGEIGARYSRPGFTATAAVWTLHLASELIYVGDGGDTETNGATDRTGVEVLAEWRPSPRFDFNLTAAVTDAKYADSPAEGDRIPNALEYVVTAGASVRITPRATGTVTLRTLGPAPLTQDGAARSNASTLVNGLLDYDFGPVRMKVELLNVFDSHGDDIRYFYTSRLQGEPAEGVDDYHFHPVEPRTVRVSLRVPL